MIWEACFPKTQKLVCEWIWISCTCEYYMCGHTYVLYVCGMCVMVMVAVCIPYIMHARVCTSVLMDM